MNAEEHIKAGHLEQAVAFAQEAIRKTPAEARSRIYFPIVVART